MHPATFQCSICKMERALQNSGGTGYGTDKDGQKVCYECCGKQDAQRMRETGKAVMYLGRRGEGQEVLNWPGSLRLPVQGTKTGRHNIAGKRYDVWFQFEGQAWHGVQYGDFTQICHCKRVKGAKP